MSKWQPQADRPLPLGNTSIKESQHPLGPLHTKDPQPWMRSATSSTSSAVPYPASTTVSQPRRKPHKKSGQWLKTSANKLIALPVDKTPKATTSTTVKRVTIAPATPIQPWFQSQAPGTNDEGFALFDAPDVKPLIPAPVPQATSLGASTIPVGPIGRSPSRTPGGSLKPIKVKALEPFKGGTRTEAKQWLARMNRWLRLSATQFNTEEDVVTFLLVNMEGTALSWVLPHLANMGTAERKITSLVQSTTTAAYATEFCTILMSLDWNDAALRAQFYKGLHWHIKQQLAQKETQPQDLEELIATAIHIDNVCHKLEISQPLHENRPKPAATATTGCTNTGWKGPKKGKETAKVADTGLENK
ncbi:hypothetical protein BN14_09946 [Rhizoctonia solani AG-1 IB]|uniref:Retrotransposon gag domain-containing protein n=1 Tax=Thanatephorus cucumeris (strain AG1-IB / isolate 7/3/14) TaxID=1108050 RepID=M5C8R0_THACB|nr:hypothetical protein BN14_09946 [Rhizoctonia solani AG-1 IB]